MASPLTARLDKLEEKFPGQRKSQRVFRLVVGPDEDADALLAAQGYNPDNGDFAIIRRVVAANGLHSEVNPSSEA